MGHETHYGPWAHPSGSRRVAESHGYCRRGLPSDTLISTGRTLRPAHPIPPRRNVDRREHRGRPWPRESAILRSVSSYRPRLSSGVGYGARAVKASWLSGGRRVGGNSRAARPCDQTHCEATSRRCSRVTPPTGADPRSTIHDPRSTIHYSYALVIHPNNASPQNNVNSAAGARNTPNGTSGVSNGGEPSASSVCSRAWPRRRSATGITTPAKVTAPSVAPRKTTMAIIPAPAHAPTSASYGDANTWVSPWKNASTDVTRANERPNSVKPSGMR